MFGSQGGAQSCDVHETFTTNSALYRASASFGEWVWIGSAGSIRHCPEAQIIPVLVSSPPKCSSRDVAFHHFNMLLLYGCESTLQPSRLNRSKGKKDLNLRQRHAVQVESPGAPGFGSLTAGPTSNCEMSGLAFLTDDLHSQNDRHSFTVIRYPGQNRTKRPCRQPSDHTGLFAIHSRNRGSRIMDSCRRQGNIVKPEP